MAGGSGCSIAGISPSSWAACLCYRQPSGRGQLPGRGRARSGPAGRLSQGRARGLVGAARHCGGWHGGGGGVDMAATVGRGGQALGRGDGDWRGASGRTSRAEPTRRGAPSSPVSCEARAFPLPYWPTASPSMARPPWSDAELPYAPSGHGAAGGDDDDTAPWDVQARRRRRRRPSDRRGFRRAGSRPSSADDGEG